MSQALQDLLKPGARSGVYRLSGRTGVKTIAGIAASAGWQFFHVDGSNVRSKVSFLKAAGQALQFPEWAGHNWDAFEELMNDLSWLPQALGTLLLLDRLSAFAASEPDQARMAVVILEAAAANRQHAHGTPLIVLVRGVGTAAGRLASLEVYANPADERRQV